MCNEFLSGIGELVVMAAIAATVYVAWCNIR